jgi:hypothetical protein
MSRAAKRDEHASWQLGQSAAAPHRGAPHRGTSVHRKSFKRPAFRTSPVHKTGTEIPKAKFIQGTLSIQ